MVPAVLVKTEGGSLTVTTANKTQWKITVFTVVAFLITILVGAWSFVSFERLVDEQEQVTRVHATRLTHAEAMHAAFEEKVANSRAYIIVGKKEVIQSVVDAREKFLTQIANLSNSVSAPAHREAVAKIKRLEQDHDFKMWELLRVRSLTPGFSARFETELRPKRLAAKSEIEQFVATIERELQLQQAKVSRGALYNRGLIFAVSSLALLFGSILAYLLLRTTHALAKSDEELRSALLISESSQERFMDLVNHLDHSVVWEADCEPFKFNFLSERLQFLLGLPPKEFVENADLYFRYTHPDDREALRAMLKRAFETHTDQRVDHRMLTVDGNEIWVHSGVHVRDNPKGIDQFYGLIVDITPLKRKEEALKKSEEALQRTTERLLLITDAQPALIAFIDHDYTYRFANAAYSRWFNKMKDEVVGKKLVEILGEQGFLKVKPKIDEALSGRASSITTELPYPDKTRFVEATYSPEFGPSGEVLGIYVTIHDLSEIKKLEAQARGTEARLREYLEAMPVMAYIADAEGNVTYYNRQWLEYTGASPEAPMDEWQPAVHPDHLERTMKRWMHSIVTGEPYEVETLVRRADGQYRWVLGRAFPVRNEQGRIVEWYGTNQDIHDYKSVLDSLSETTERLSLALDAAKIGVWELNLKSYQVVWSKELAQMFGFSPSKTSVTWEEAAGRVHEWDREMHRRAFGNALREKSYHVEFRVVWPDGSVHWLYGSGVIHDDESGKPSRLVGVNIDITERKEHEIRLQQEKETREKFVSLIIHDLRTPLSAAKMAAQLMVRKKDDPETTTLLIGRVVENANRMEAMIRDLLDTNKIKAGKRLTVAVGKCDLRDIVAKTLEDLTLIYGDRFKMISPADAPGVWDCSGLRRVTENLVTNAVKYGDPHEKITISVRQVDRFSELSVHNVGEKLSEVELGSLFDQFARTHSAEKSGKAGWGIGLTLVKGIAEAHGGKVQVKSDSTGTTFTVWLPTDATAFVASDVSFGAPLEH